MIQSPDVEKLERVVQKIDRQGKLLTFWALKGGLSAQMTAFEMRLADGQTRKVIVRQPGARAVQHNAYAAADEYAILQSVQAAGVIAQAPYLLDESGEIFHEPYLVIEYIEGNPEYAPANITVCVEQMATQLAALHRIKSSTFDPSVLAHLPKQTQRLQRTIQQRPTTMDHSLDEGRIRSILEAAWPLSASQEPVLLHGDFWPGNLLWKDGKLVAVIDWEDAEVGNPLVDFAISRLDVLWIYGLDALHVFTRRYQTLMTCDSGPDFSQLPYWDLFAALRPASRIAEWAAGWPELGRSDITEATMRAKHHWFVAQAFENLLVR